MRSSDIALLLPEVYRRTIAADEPLALLLDVMERMHAPVEALLVELDAYWRPDRTPDAFLPFLALWLDLEGVFGEARGSGPPPAPRFASGSGRLRDVLVHAPELLRMRGTEAGLLRFLELAVGRSGFRLHPRSGAAGVELAFGFDLETPPLSPAELDLVRRIVRHEKPAHVVVAVLPPGSATEGAAAVIPP
jgi:phage tail-like protein